MIFPVLSAKELKDIINTSGIKKIYKNVNQNIQDLGLQYRVGNVPVIFT